MALIAWTSLGEWKALPIGGGQPDYYNLLVSGFRKGSLALDVPVPDALRNAEDPWNPSKRPPNVGMHDVSYYNGRYYLYFGVVPAVLLFWPFRAVTGQALPFVYSSLVFALGAFLLAAWLWLRILRDHFPRASLATRVGGVAAIGLAGGQLVLARRCSIWEMPITAGHCFVLLMLAAGYLALQSRRPWAWLAASGASLGLAFGSRPTLAAAGAGLVFIVLGVGLRDPEVFKWTAKARRTVLAALCAGIPLAVIVGCLMAYNDARFGNPLEFGLNYQINSNYERGARHFSLSFIPFNFAVYFLKMPQWGRYFPFLHPISPPPSRPDGYYGYEYVYGALVVCPVLWWAACIPGQARAARRNRGFAFFAAAVAATALASTGVLLCFNTAAARYTVDFLPWCVWLGALGWAVLEARLSPGETRSPPIRRILIALFAATAVLSCFLAFCASVELHDVLQFLNPSGYRGIARVFDAPVALAEKLVRTESGPVEMDVTFAAKPSGSYEPLLVTGEEYQKDYVYFYYQSAAVVRIGYMSNGEIANSGDIAISPGRKYHIRIECGSLYPPDGILFYSGYSLNEVHALKGWVQIDFDGRRVLTTRKAWNEATPGSLRIGEDSGEGKYARHFSGTITRVHRGSWPARVRDLQPVGDVRLDLAIPDEGLEGNQPLLSAGRAGLADMVAVRMPDGGHAVLLYESWGQGIWPGVPFALSRDRVATVRIRFGPALRVDAQSPMAILRRTVVAWVGDVPVLWDRTHYPLEPNPPISEVSNDLGSSAMVARFQGRLCAATSGPPPAPWRAGPFSAVEMDLLGRGEGVEPLVSTGPPGQSDILAVEWLPGARARLLYTHFGRAPRQGAPFEWSNDRIHTLRVGMPSLRALDATGPADGHQGVLRIGLDGSSLWEQPVPFYLAASGTVEVGRNPSEAPPLEESLRCVVADLRQVPE